VLLALPEEHSSLRTEGKDFVITSPGGATLTLSAPTTAEVGCSGAAVQAVDGVCVPRVPACTGDTVTVVNGACVAKDSTVDSTTAGYIQRLVDEKLGQRLEELVDERLLSVTSRIDMVESTDAWQNTTIDHIAAKFHPSTQWECAQITAYAGACRAEVGSQSAFLTYVEAGISGTDACVRALCGRTTGSSCSGTSGSGNDQPYCKSSTQYYNDIQACHFGPSCVGGWKHDGYRYGNECSSSYAGQGFACCKQASNVGPGPLAGIIADNSRREGGAFTNILARCPMLDTGCSGHGCAYN